MTAIITAPLKRLDPATDPKNGAEPVAEVAAPDLDEGGYAQVKEEYEATPAEDALEERRYSVAEYLEQGLWEDEDGFSYELIGGKIVPKEPRRNRKPAPSAEHGRIMGKLSQFMGNYLDEHKLGEFFANSGCVIDEANGDFFIPDLLFMTNARVPADLQDSLPYPDLAIEIVSRTDIWYEVRAKVSKYHAVGTRAVWVVFPPDREVLVYYPDRKLTLTATEALEGGELLPGFSPLVGSLFA